MRSEVTGKHENLIKKTHNFLNGTRISTVTSLLLLFKPDILAQYI